MYTILRTTDRNRKLMVILLTSKIRPEVMEEIKSMPDIDISTWDEMLDYSKSIWDVKDFSNTDCEWYYTTNELEEKAFKPLFEE